MFWCSRGFEAYKRRSADMGNLKSVQCDLSSEKIGELVNLSSGVFTPHEVRALWFHFKTISSKGDYITRQQFQSALLFKESALLDLIFRRFDQDDDDSISFSEYLSCCAIVSSKATQDAKLRLSFQIYDYDGDGRISTEDLTTTLAVTLREHNIVVSRADIDAIVANTMREAAPKEPGLICFSEFKSLASQRPAMLDHLSVNISKIIEEYGGKIETSSLGISFATPRRG